MLVRLIRYILRIAKTDDHKLILLGLHLLPPPDLAKLGTVLEGIVKSKKIKNIHEVMR